MEKQYVHYDKEWLEYVNGQTQEDMNYEFKQWISKYEAYNEE